MSPEQAMGRRLDHRSDLFSLGTVMYEMLTLEAPFQAPTEVELIFAVRDAQKRDARELAPALPEDLNDILNKLMSRSRSQRFQSGEELALALRVFLDRYRPGYRRSNFGRFMRSEFAESIERELRLLEEYVIDSADPTRVGENLIADALPKDAIYTQFTAAAAQATDDHQHSRAIDPGGTPIGTTGHLAAGIPLGDLHAEPTRILLRDGPAPAPLAEQETRILTLPTEAPHARAVSGDDTDGGLAPLGELQTRILQPPPTSPQRSDRSLHELQTRILKRPDPPTDPATPKVVVAPSGDDEVDENEATSVPLGDDDLEPA
jgi:hypothetical protein